MEFINAQKVYKGLAENISSMPDSQITPQTYLPICMPASVSFQNLAVEGASRQLDASGMAITSLKESHLGQISHLLAELGDKKLFSGEEIAHALYDINTQLKNVEPFEEIKVIEANGEIAGFAYYGKHISSDNFYELYWLAVKPSMQGRGIGKLLLSEAESEAKAKGAKALLIETSSKKEQAAARAVYEKAGYILISKINDFYGKNSHLLLYRKDLD